MDQSAMLGVDASIVLAPYLESIVRGRRVVVLGDASSSVGPALLERGARLVHIYDPDAVRAAESAARRPPSRSLVFAPLPEGDLAVRDGAFEAVVVPDITLFERADDVFARARRLVASTGAAVFASPNPEMLPPGRRQRGDVLSYYELYDAVALQFAQVRMLGQAPFAGYVIADFAPDEETEVVIDTSLLERGAEEPGWFVVLASQRPQRIDPYTIVQVPQQLVATEVAGGELDSMRAELAQARGKLAPLEQEIQALRQRTTDLQAQAASASRVAELEQALRERDDQLRKAEARAGDTHVRAGQLEGKVRDLDEELRHQRERAFKLHTELEEEKKQRTRAELELRMIRRSSELPAKPERSREEEAARAEALARIKQAEEMLAAANQRVAALEQELESARGRISGLQSELQRTREQVSQLELREGQLQDQLAQATLHAQAAQRAVELEQALQMRDRHIAELDAQVLKLEQQLAEAAAVPKQDLEQARQQLETAQRQRDEAVRAVEQMQRMQELELTALERALEERGREVLALHTELRRRAELAQELIGLLEERGVQGPASDGDSAHSLRAQLDQLAALAARREAELQQASWRIEQLEQQAADVAAGVDGGTLHSELEQALFAAQNELDVLRRSLQRERDLRARAEAGSDAAQALGHAQADLQAQAVLVTSVASADHPEPSSR